MEFKSQICTTREQSERLLKLGFKAETADMMYSAITVIKGKQVKEPIWKLCTVYCPKKSIILYDNEEQVFIPAWSLHRLIELLGGNVTIDDFAIDWVYDTVIDYIAFDIRHDQFNHEYLEEKK